jgi:diguanylate cyclase (GGDEF)-like protein
MYEREVEELIDKMAVFEKAFDKSRLIDPTNNMILDFKDSKVIDSGINCFEYWRKGKVCDNCVAMRAHREDDTFIKIEYFHGDIYIVVAFPVKLKDRIVVIELLKKATNNIVLGQEQKELAGDINYMIDNLNYVARKDSLTGIYNRRYINERMPVDIRNEELSAHSISVIMADLDSFKNINDTYGHLVGDCVLKCFADILQKGLRRDNDWVARYGGEEFLICMPGAGLQLSMEMAEHFRKVLEETEMECGGFRIRITASFGVFSTVPNSVTTMNNMIESADKMLYEAKHKGKNRVEGYSA